MLAAGNAIPKVVRSPAAGANIDEVEITRGWTALIWAAKRGHRDTVALLLALGANRDLVDHQGRTARDWALAQQPALALCSDRSGFRSGAGMADCLAHPDCRGCVETLFPCRCTGWQQGDHCRAHVEPPDLFAGTEVPAFGVTVHPACRLTPFATDFAVPHGFHTADENCPDQDYSHWSEIGHEVTDHTLVACKQPGYELGGRVADTEQLAGHEYHRIEACRQTAGARW